MSEKEREYERMRGEYLSLMASLEFDLTFLMVEYLKVENYREEFRQWFTHAPIPLGSKIRLFESMIGETLAHQFGDVATQLRKSQDFRNTLAHSFRQLDRTMTSRGREVPAERVTFEALRDELEKLRSLEDLIGGMLAAELQGPLPPISADDYADWPP